MKINEFDDIAVNGQFDIMLQKGCPTYQLITWRVMKSLAFSESELHPYVENGLFRTPNRIFREFEGSDPYNPIDAIATAYRIVCYIWDCLFVIPDDKERLLYTIASYKLRIFKPLDLTGISITFKGLYSYFPLPVLHDIIKVRDYSEVL